MIWQSIKLLLKNKSFIMICILLIFANGIFQYKTTMDDVFDKNVYKETISWLTDEAQPLDSLSVYRREILEDPSNLRFLPHLYQEIMLTSELSSYADGVLNYEAKVEQLINDTRARAMFFKTEEKGAKETTSTYQRLLSSDQRPTLGNYFAFGRWVKLGFTDGVLCILLLAAATFLIIQERERGMYTLIKTMKLGRTRYFLQKATTLVLVGILASIVLYLSSLIVLIAMLGTGPWSVAIQSVPGHMLNPFPVTILGYATMFLIFKIASCIIMTLFITFLCFLPLKAPAIYLTYGISMGVSAILYYKIYPGSTYVLLKHINLISLMDTAEITNKLYYVSVFGKQYSLQGIMLTFAGLFFAILTVAGMIAYLTYKKTYSAAMGKKKTRLYGFNGFTNEATRLLLHQKGLLIIAAFIMIIVFANDFTVHKNDLDTYYKNAVDHLNALDIDEAEKWIEKRQEELERLEGEIISLGVLLQEGQITEDAYQQATSTISQQLYYRSVVTELEEQSAHIRDMKESKGITCVYLYKAYYNALFDQDGDLERYMNTTIFALFSVSLLAPIFSFDRQYKMERILGATSRGNKYLLKTRFRILLPLQALMYIAMQVIWYSSLSYRYGIKNISGNIQSLPIFKDFPIVIDMRVMLILQLLTGILLVWLFCTFIFSISIKNSDVIQSLLIGTIACVCPFILAFVNFDLAKMFWLGPFLAPSLLFYKFTWPVILNMVVMTSFIVLFAHKAVKDYTSAQV